MRKVVVTGCSGWVGRALCENLVTAGYEVIGIDRRAPLVFPDEATFVLDDLANPDIKERFSGADCVVHAAWDIGENAGVLGAPAENLQAMRTVLDAAGAANVSQLIFMSCAVVYGAWESNPVPLTETAPINPNESYSFAVQKAEAEQALDGWSLLHPQVGVTTLRPVVIVTGQTDSPLARVLGGHRALREPGADHHVQFVHLDDVVSALTHVIDRRLTGTYNVAPTGWIFEREARELVGTSSELRVPSALRNGVRSIRFAFGRYEDSPTVDPYIQHAWVVANDALRATGWEPKYSNQEALVSWQPLTWWGRQSPARRRGLIAASAITAAASAVAGTAAAANAFVKKKR